MRTRMLIAALLALGAATAAVPASAQTYGGYPVCLHVYGPVTYYDCAYSSIAQCNGSAAGRAAQCVVNPYAAAAPPVRYARRYRPVY
jgi:hypothetical protein